jgi:hypothetical protein
MTCDHEPDCQATGQLYCYAHDQRDAPCRGCADCSDD